jgi:hypothetical protein
MKTISFEKLRAQFWDASFELPGYHSHCTGFHHNFSFEFNESMAKRAWEHLDRARKFVADRRKEFPAGDKKRSLDKLDALIVESYCRLAVTMATENVTYTPKAHKPDINDEFLF